MQTTLDSVLSWLITLRTGAIAALGFVIAAVAREGPLQQPHADRAARLLVPARLRDGSTNP